MRLKRPSFLLSAALFGVLIGAGFGELAPFFVLFFISAITFSIIGAVLRMRPLWLFLLFALSGVLLGYGRLETQLDMIPKSDPGEVQVLATIQRVEEDPDRQRLTMKNLRFNDSAKDGKLLVFAPSFPELRPGDELRFTCDVEQPEPFDGFSYDKFLAARGIQYTCFARSFEVVGARQSLWRIVHTPRAYLDRQIESRFGFAESSLLAGLLYGEKEFTDGMEDAFQRTGTTHIVAASGYNVTIVALVLFALLTHLYVPRRRAFALILIGVWVYVLLVGLEAPIVRAGLMGSVVLLSRQLGRAAKYHNALLLAGALLAIASPLAVRYDVGFQLSMLSTFGLMYLSPRIADTFTFVPEDFGLRESITSTIAATLITLPLIVFQFASFSLVSPIANLLVLPWLPYAMLFGVLAAALPGLIAAPFVALAQIFVAIPLVVIDALSGLSFAYLEFNSILVKVSIALAAILLTLWLLKPSHEISS
jgi:competence protein ComEC